MISTNITNNIALDLRELIIKRDESLRNFLPEDSVIIASLLHDVCKADIYKPSVLCLQWIDALIPHQKRRQTIKMIRRLISMFL